MRSDFLLLTRTQAHRWRRARQSHTAEKSKGQIQIPPKRKECLLSGGLTGQARKANGAGCVENMLSKKSLPVFC